MASLPLTVNAVDYRGSDMYGVEICFADGTTAEMIVPASLATIEAVTIAAVAIAQFRDVLAPSAATHHRGHRRYDPRTGN